VRHANKPLLIAVNGAALTLLWAMTDLESSTRAGVAAAIVVNILLLIGKRALGKRPAQLGAWASLAGYAGTVGSWLVLALGCGIEYFNARCDQVVTPLITASVIVSLVGLPVGRICALLVKDEA
jgi:hypothetical protein